MTLRRSLLRLHRDTDRRAAQGCRPADRVAERLGQTVLKGDCTEGPRDLTKKIEIQIMTGRSYVDL